MALGMSGVEAVQIRSKQSCLVAAGTGTDLDNGIAAIIRIFGNQESASRLFQLLQLLLQLSQLGLRQFNELCVLTIGDDLFRLITTLMPLPIRAGNRYDLLQLTLFTGQTLILSRLTRDLWIG